MAVTVPATGFNFITADVIGAGGIHDTSFVYMTILGIDLYGTAGANNGIRLLTRIFTDATTKLDRDFDDFGTQGAQRPHIKVKISAKDQQFLPTGSADVLFGVFCLDPIGAPVAGSVIVDVLCQFKNTGAVVRARRDLYQAGAHSVIRKDPPVPPSLVDGHRDVVSLSESQPAMADCNHSGEITSETLQS